MSNYKKKKVLFFFITKIKLDIDKEIIISEEKSPSEQASESSPVQTAHVSQEGEHMALVLSSISVLFVLSSIQLTEVQSLWLPQQD